MAEYFNTVLAISMPMMRMKQRNAKRLKSNCKRINSRNMPLMCHECIRLKIDTVSFCRTFPFGMVFISSRQSALIKNIRPSNNKKTLASVNKVQISFFQMLT